MSDFIHQQPIILASASQSRIELLRALGLQFEVIPANSDEEGLKRTFTGPKLELAALLASSKAMEVSQHYPDHFVIGADQLCLIGEQC
uniref:Maf family protein n=1 Tax=Legionella tunisiensis TaxID=1034944 RepID=UPI00037DEC85